MNGMESLNVTDITMSDYDYSLPLERIASFPLSQRDQSKLLVFKEGSICDDKYFNLPNHLPENSLLVFNNTKVVQARLHFKTSSGAVVELFCLGPKDRQLEMSQALQQRSGVQWICLVGELKKWKEEILTLNAGDEKCGCKLQARKVNKEADAFVIEFSWQPEELTFSEVLEYTGKIPLPPYIKRETQREDKQRYQTVYAKSSGSVAAPTAGLHFTAELLKNLHTKNIATEYVTLHIGAGTFKPVKSSTIGSHKMHSEEILVERSCIEKLIRHIHQPLVAIGTTSLRTLESLYWIGLKMHSNTFDPTKEVLVGQWDPYQLPASISTLEALQTIVNFLKKEKKEAFLTRTQLMIAPGYDWKMVDALVTNFHQPKSTLILLVAAFIGNNWKNIYQHAVENDYRFLSYGDGSLLFRSKGSQEE